jgi:NAD(P)H dehydrogenase (quinone)
MAKEKILVTGASGTTGRRTVEILCNHGREVRAVVHKESLASERLQALGAEVFVGDLLDFHSIRSAFDGIGPAYFCYPLSPSAIDAAALFAQAAVEAEVSAIVNISQICAGRESKSHAAFNHWIEERLLDRTGIPTTHLRPTFFAEWFVYPGHLAQINSGLVRFPFSAGKHAPISGEDQARLIATILESPQAHAGKTYNLCGPHEQSYPEWIARLSNLLRRDIRYEVTSDDETREIFAGWYGEFAAQHIVAVAKDYNNGLFAGTDEVIEKFTGKKPMGFEEFTRQHLALYNVEHRPPVSRPASQKQRAS